jgi:hypothetical protein
MIGVLVGAAIALGPPPELVPRPIAFVGGCVPPQPRYPFPPNL